MQASQIQSLTKRVLELESRLNQNSRNSSKPPSSDTWKRPVPRKSSGAKPGGQPGHKGNFIKIEREADETIELKPEQCAKCGEDLREITGTTMESRNKIEVEIRTKLTEYKQTEVVCPCCSNANREEFPVGINSHVQYGEGVRSIGVLLTQYANVSYDKTAKIMNDVLEVPISTGTLVNHVKEFAVKSKPVLEAISDNVKRGETGHFDETSMKVSGGKWWLHTAGNSEATYNTAHPSRGTVGTDDNGVLKEFRGVAVHDCLVQYFKYNNCLHAVCNAHLLRELQGIIDNTNQLWAVDMAELLREMKRAVDDFKLDGQTELPEDLIEDFSQKYDRILKVGEIESPRDTEKKKQSKSRNLLDRFIGYRREITRFAGNFAVPFDNNQAERDIRNAKVKMKVSGGFRSDEGAKNFGKISSVIGTAVKQGTGVFKTVTDIFAGSLSSIFREKQHQQ